mgnify:CR=1 FL=1
MANEINNKYIYSRPSLISLVWDESHIEPRVFVNKIPVIIKPQPQSQPHPQQSSEEYLYYYTQLQQGVVYTISQYEEITPYHTAMSSGNDHAIKYQPITSIFTIPCSKKKNYLREELPKSSFPQKFSVCQFTRDKESKEKVRFQIAGDGSTCIFQMAE